MTQETDLLLRLVRASLWQDPRQLDGFPRLSEHEWTLVYRESKRQTVSGVALDGVGMLPDPLFPPRQLLLRWVARGDAIERACRRMERDSASLLALFRREGLSPVVQKGLAAGRFYPRPRLRVCGDIDLCFDPLSRRKADALIASLGTPLKVSADGSAVYRWDDSEVEHHSDLVELQSPLARRRMKDPGQLPAHTVSVASGLEIPVPTPATELLMIGVHILKHCFGAGVGLRHFCDYAMARRALMPLIGEGEWTETCRRLGVARWIRVLDTFTDLYLSPTPPALNPNTSSLNLAKRILALMEEGGNFGLHPRGSASRHGQNGPRRKLGTASSFLRHASLSARIAPAEALAVFLSLVRGNLGLRAH